MNENLNIEEKIKNQEQSGISKNADKVEVITTILLIACLIAAVIINYHFSK